MAQVISIENFISTIQSSQQVILDVRSENEFWHGHIPGAVNLPLLNNEERTIVGTIYKKDGREAAVHIGFELTGKKFASFIEQAKVIATDKEVMMYCWRGGMRSNIMAWILNMAGFKVTLLKGGYKSFRSWALNQFNQQKHILILGGKTGSGKTELLIDLKKSGEQFIDLEDLANHKGSAFGSLGKPEQPRQEHFENMLALQWNLVDADKILWLENESQTIGFCKIPDVIFLEMRNAFVIEVDRSFEIRKQRILSEYGTFSKELLAEKTNKVAKRLGGLRLKQALDFLNNNELDNWCDIMLEYYDKTYSHSNARRRSENFISVETDEKNPSIEKLLTAKSEYLKMEKKSVS